MVPSCADGLGAITVTLDAHRLPQVVFGSFWRGRVGEELRGPGVGFVSAADALR